VLLAEDAVSYGGGGGKAPASHRLIGVMELDIVDGAVQSVGTIVNPDKLSTAARS
jgi:hypothetical protein